MAVQVSGVFGARVAEGQVMVESPFIGSVTVTLERVTFPELLTI